MPANLTSDVLWDALYRIGSEDGAADQIAPEIIDRLIEFKIARIGATGQPALTPFDEKCFVLMESGDGSVPEFNDYPPAEV